LSEEIQVHFGADTSEIDKAMRGLQHRVIEFGKELRSHISGIFAGAAIIRGAEKLHEYLEKLEHKSKELGVSTDFLQGFYQGAGKVGVESEKATKGLELFFQKLGEAQTGSKEAAAAFDKWGVATKDQNRNVRDGVDVLGDVAEKIRGAESGAVRAAIAANFFGKSWRDITPALQEGREAILKMRDESMFKIDHESIEAYGHTWEKLKTVIKDAGGALLNLAMTGPKLAAKILQFFTAAKDYGSFSKALIEIRDGVNDVNESGGLRLISDSQRVALQGALDLLGKAVNELYKTEQAAYLDSLEPAEKKNELLRERAELEQNLAQLSRAAHAAEKAADGEWDMHPDLWEGQLNREKATVEHKKKIAEINTKIAQTEKEITREAESRTEMQQREFNLYWSARNAQTNLATARSDFTKFSLSDLVSKGQAWDSTPRLSFGRWVTNQMPPAVRMALQAQRELDMAQNSQLWGNTAAANLHLQNYEKLVKDNPALKSNDQLPFQSLTIQVKEQTKLLDQALNKDGIKIQAIPNGR
jgi:hypothetical protein